MLNLEGERESSGFRERKRSNDRERREKEKERELLTPGLVETKCLSFFLRDSFFHSPVFRYSLYFFSSFCVQNPPLFSVFFTCLSSLLVLSPFSLFSPLYLSPSLYSISPFYLNLAPLSACMDMPFMGQRQPFGYHWRAPMGCHSLKLQRRALHCSVT